jgi:hypothetical protein
MRTDAGLSKFKSPADLAKSYLEVQKLVGSKVSLPGADAKPEEWDAFYNKVGRPEKITDYKYDAPKLPEGMEMPKDMTDAFLGVAHKAGLSQQQVQALMGWYGNTAEGQVAMSGKAVMEGQAALKTEWGADWDKNLKAAQTAFKGLFGEDKETQALLTTTGFDKHPVFLKMFAKLGAEMGEKPAAGKGAEAGGTASDATDLMGQAAKLRQQILDGGRAMPNEIKADLSRQIQKLYAQAYPESA